MAKGQSLQDPFLNALRRDHVPVSVYLVNGIKLQGTVESYDQFVVLLRSQVSQMVYKHAISTIVPSRNVHIDPVAGSEPVSLPAKPVTTAATTVETTATTPAAVPSPAPEPSPVAAAAKTNNED